MTAYELRQLRAEIGFSCNELASQARPPFPHPAGYPGESLVQYHEMACA